MATQKQEKLVTLILENLGTEGLTKSMGELLKEAGYSKALQKNPKMILETEGVQEGLSEVADKFDKLRKKALKELEGRKLDKEPYRDLIKGIDTLTKNYQLVTGGDTERNTQPLMVKIIGKDE